MNLFARLRQRLSRGWLIFNEGGRPQGPPDLDELWRDFNRKLSGLLSGRGGRGSSGGNGSSDGPSGGGKPDLKGAGVGAGVRNLQEVVVTLLLDAEHLLDLWFSL